MCASRVRGGWEAELAPGVWHALPPEALSVLRDAQQAGVHTALYSVGEVSYEVDVSTCTQTNWETGAQQQLRWSENAGCCSMVAKPSGAHDTVYQWQLKNGAWVDYDRVEQSCFVGSWMSGQNVARFLAYGFEYEVDFLWMRQTNLHTGQVRQVRVRPWEDASSLVEELEAQGLEGHLTGTCGNCAFAQTPPSTYGASAAANAGPEVGIGRGAWRASVTTATATSIDGHGSRRVKRRSLDPGGLTADAKEGRAPRREASHFGGTGFSAHGGDGEGAGYTRESSTAQSWQGALPTGATWPADLAARRASSELVSWLAQERTSADTRSRAFRAACLRWHPDKNPDQEDVATEVFQFLQGIKGWYLHDATTRDCA